MKYLKHENLLGTIEEQKCFTKQQSSHVVIKGDFNAKITVHVS